MEKFKWLAAETLGTGALVFSLVASVVIIVAEVLKYTAAKRLYRLFPWLGSFVNLK